MNNADKIKALRALMLKHNYKAYIIASSDPHTSEYVASTWASRQWISGFTGSAGLVVITQDLACLWTDSRYFIQAEDELRGSEIKLFRQGDEGIPSFTKWLKSQLSYGSTIAFDGKCISLSMSRNIEKELSQLDINLDGDKDLIDNIWTDRPQIPSNKIFMHDISKSGKTIDEKLKLIRNEMHKHEANIHFVGSLDDIAWIFNIRGSDVDYNPVAISYALITMDKATLYICEHKYEEELASILASSNIDICDYSQIFEDLKNIPQSSNLLLDINRTNLSIYEAITANIIEDENPSQLMKSIKNETEIKGFKSAMLKDGVAMENFLYWLETNIAKAQIKESDIIYKLKEFRSEQEDFFCESFGTIAGYAEHGALPHYSTNENTDIVLEQKSFVLIDSGAQYKDGTTDITRTIPLGELNNEEKTDYTLVLKGMIQLSMAKFPKGTPGCNLDILARQALWFHARDYGHGTGHGVGSFLNVHEGPQSIRQDLKNQSFFAGMVTSNEPAIYRDGKYGIRHENIILCKESEISQFGEFLEFETLTLCHFETKAILTELLTPLERDWINAYHTRVYKEISPLLEKEKQNWLKQKTKSI